MALRDRVSRVSYDKECKNVIELIRDNKENPRARTLIHNRMLQVSNQITIWNICGDMPFRDMAMIFVKFTDELAKIVGGDKTLEAHFLEFLFDGYCRISQCGQVYGNGDESAVKKRLVEHAAVLREKGHNMMGPVFSKKIDNFSYPEMAEAVKVLLAGGEPKQYSVTFKKIKSKFEWLAGELSCDENDSRGQMVNFCTLDRGSLMDNVYEVLKLLRFPKPPKAEDEWTLLPFYTSIVLLNSRECLELARERGLFAVTDAALLDELLEACLTRNLLGCVPELIVYKNAVKNGREGGGNEI